MSVMKEIKIEKLTLNIGAGKEQSILEKGVKLLQQITGAKPIKTITQKRIAAWGLRPGLPIGCKVTLRREQAKDMLKRLLYAKDGVLSQKQFDNEGNVAFGIKEYIDIQDAKYDHAIGLMGLEACITLIRPGFRIKKRRLLKAKISKHHRIKKEEAIDFMKKNFNLKIAEEEQEK